MNALLNVTKYIFFITITLLFSSCVATKTIPEGYTGPRSLIWDGLLQVAREKHYIFEVLKVNGTTIKTSSRASANKRFDFGLRTSATSIARELPSGTHELTLQAIPHTAKLTGKITDAFFAVNGTVIVDLKPNTAYAVSGKLSEDYLLVWLEEEETGIIVSEILFKGEFSEEQASQLRAQKVQTNIARLRKLNKEKALEDKTKADALAFYQGGNCDKMPVVTDMHDYFRFGEALFTHKLGDFGLSCLLAISEYEAAPKQTFQYLALIYDLGLGIEEDPSKANFWRKKR